MDPNSTVRRSIENGRAKKAYAYVEQALKDHNSVNQKEYKAYVKKMAPFIKTNGLGNTLAFYYAKGSKNRAYELICSQLEDWFKEQRLIDKDLLEEIVSLDSSSYRYLTNESMALLNWWQRFVESQIEDQE